MPSTTSDWSATGQYNDDRFGYSVAGAGDVNGDGYADVVVGAYGFQGGANNGKAYAFYGSATGLSTTANWSSTGENGGSFGYSVAGAGDVNGDGYADVVVSAPLYTGAGRVYIFYGSASGLNAAWGWQEAGEESNDHFGISVAGAGDVNGDGYADVIIGADYYGSDNGRVYVYHGGASGPGTTWDWVETGDTASLRLGGAVAGAGDVNGDGFADVVAGAPFRDEPATSAGKAYVYLGNDGSLGRTVTPQQARADGSRRPVQPWGLSHAAGSFYLSIQATDPMGRGRVKLEVESCPPGVPFGDADCARRQSGAWKDVTATASGIPLAMTISELKGETLYRWRARVLHAPIMVTRVVITPPPNPAHGPWRRFQAQSFEADVRTVSWIVYLPLATRSYGP